MRISHCLVSMIKEITNELLTSFDGRNDDTLTITNKAKNHNKTFFIYKTTLKKLRLVPMAQLINCNSTILEVTMTISFYCIIATTIS